MKFLDRDQLKKSGLWSLGFGAVFLVQELYSDDTGGPLFGKNTSIGIGVGMIITGIVFLIIDWRNKKK